MPLSEADLLDVARLARVFADAEARTLERVLKSLTADIDEPDWQVMLLARLQRLTRAVLDDLEPAQAAYVQAVRRRLTGLYAGGAASVYADLGDLDTGSIVDVGSIADQRRRAVVANLTREMTAGVTEATAGLLRSTDDVYRRVIGETVELVAARGVSKRDALRDATRSLLGQGIPAFRDSRGRKWTMQSYVDMATRTGYANAQIRGHEDAMDAAGLDLVIVQPGPRACPICDRWARLILTRGGVAGARDVENAVTGEMMRLDVDDTLAAARAAGFQHPNCRCSLRAFIPGATKRATIQRPAWDAEGYERQQQQRHVERGIRQTKTRALVAEATGDLSGTERAKRRLAAQQGDLRALLAANPVLKRRPDREQIVKVGEAPPAPPPPPAGKPDPRGKDFRDMTNAERIEAARIMYGSNSPQYRAARKRFRR